jgi:hypothetical protein
MQALLRRRVVATMTRLLTKPLQTYEQRVPNDLPSLKQQVRVGDVILVQGDQRISQVIRYLTQSSWSHSALYIGDELQRLHPTLAKALLAQYGDNARYLLIEADAADGVVCTPIAKYVRHNVRLCRPHGLRREDLDRVITELLGQLGRPYSVRHIWDLARYFFPVRLIPARFRRAALQFGGKTTRPVICSTMLARAFANVGYPIVPRVVINDRAEPPGWLHRLLGRNGHGVHALYSRENPSLVTPRDFDLSPYFEIVKFNHLASGKFDYRRIEWAHDGRAETAGTPPPARIPGNRPPKASAA